MTFKEFRTEDTSINEAAFSEGKIVKVADLVARVMSKQFSSKFYNIGLETFKSRLHGKGAGVRYINDKGAQLRFNWTQKEGKKSQYLITSVDYWDINNLKTRPTMSIKLGADINIVQVVAVIAEAFKKRQTGKIDITMTEAKSSGERKDWLKSKGLPTSYGDSEGNTRRRAAKAGLTSELEAFLGGEETNSFDEEVADVEKTVEKTPYADPAVVFDDIEDLTRAIVAGVATSLIIAGDPGTGKTWHVEETLKTSLGSPKGESAKWRMFTGSLAPFALYSALYFNRDKIIFFDDADSVWKNEDTINMMKAALDTRPVRNVGWKSGFTIPVDGLSQDHIDELESLLDLTYTTDPTKIGKGKWRLPSEFEFTGSVIFTSNKSSAFFSKIGGGAIKSRSFFVDVHLRRSDLLNRIRGIAIAKGYDHDLIESAMEALGKTTGELSIRALLYAIKMQQAHMPNWADLASRYL